MKRLLVWFIFCQIKVLFSSAWSSFSPGVLGRDRERCVLFKFGTFSCTCYKNQVDSINQDHSLSIIMIPSSTLPRVRAILKELDFEEKDSKSRQLDSKNILHFHHLVSLGEAADEGVCSADNTAQFRILSPEG